MSADSHSALNTFIVALENFHRVAIDAESMETLDVLQAEQALVDAYTLYDDIMFTHYGIEVPLDLYGNEYEPDEDDELGQSAETSYEYDEYDLYDTDSSVLFHDSQSSDE